MRIMAFVLAVTAGCSSPSTGVENIDRAAQAAALEAQIGVTRADLQLAQNELDRAMQLVARGFISKADVDRKTATRDATRARVNVANA